MKEKEAFILFSKLIGTENFFFTQRDLLYIYKWNGIIEFADIKLTSLLIWMSAAVHDIYDFSDSRARNEYAYASTIIYNTRSSAYLNLGINALLLF